MTFPLPSFSQGATLIQGLLDLSITKNPKVVEQMVIDVRKNNYKRTYKGLDPKITLTKKRALYKIIYSILNDGNLSDLHRDIAKVKLRPQETKLIETFITPISDFSTVFLRDHGLEDSILNKLESDIDQICADNSNMTEDEERVYDNYFNFTQKVLSKGFRHSINTWQLILDLHSIHTETIHRVKENSIESPTRVLSRTEWKEKLSNYLIITEDNEVLTYNKENFINLYNRHIDWVKNKKYRAKKLTRERFIKKNTDFIFKVDQGTDKTVEEILEDIKATNPILGLTATYIIKLLKEEMISSKNLPKIFGLRVPKNNEKKPLFFRTILPVAVTSTYSFHKLHSKVLMEIKEKVPLCVAPITWHVEDVKRELKKKFHRKTIRKAREFLTEGKGKYSLKDLLYDTGIKTKKHKELIDIYGEKILVQALEEIYFDDP
jgi:hypothetical protein